MNIWIKVSFLLLISIHEVFSRDVFDSSLDLMDVGVTNPNSSIWISPQPALHVGECAGLCFLDITCLSFTFNHKLYLCQGYNILMGENHPDLIAADGVQYFYKTNLPLTSTTLSATTTKKVPSGARIN